MRRFDVGVTIVTLHLRISTPSGFATTSPCRLQPCCPVTKNTFTKAKKFRIFASAHQSRHVCCTSTQEVVPDNSVCMILLAGGVGKRMGAKIPKQHLELNGRSIATYSLETFAKMREVGEIVIVCGESWRYVFEEAMTSLGIDIPFKWASPGAERQNSVFNGLQEVSAGCEMVGVHDSARPLVQPDDLAWWMDGTWGRLCWQSESRKP
ncbi:hypothetical protein BSKO_03227 [Bryopsis sp. KO-2023]|nr:hypothetical protein BSKO_03227 [Bryopsis sp. KO-2023]